MSIAKIQTGDKVKVIAGSYKGTEGVVTQVVTKKMNKKPSIVRAAVNTIPAITKYKKANRAYNMPGEMLTTDRLINVSNLALVDDKGKVSRSSVKVDAKTGLKTRVYKTTNALVTKSNKELADQKLDKKIAESKTTKTIAPTKKK